MRARLCACTVIYTDLHVVFQCISQRNMPNATLKLSSLRNHSSVKSKYIEGDKKDSVCHKGYYEESPVQLMCCHWKGRCGCSFIRFWRSHNLEWSSRLNNSTDADFLFRKVKQTLLFFGGGCTIVRGITRYPTAVPWVRFVGLQVTREMGNFHAFRHQRDGPGFVSPSVSNFIADLATVCRCLFAVEPPEDEESRQEDEEAFHHDTHEEDHAVGYTVQPARHHVAEEPAHTKTQRAE